MAITSQQITYIVYGALLIAILWRIEMLPSMMSNVLDKYLPVSIANFVKGEQVVAAAVDADVCPPKGKCDDFRSDKQCGLCPNGCQWVDQKCKSRGLTPPEKSA